MCFPKSSLIALPTTHANLTALRFPESTGFFFFSSYLKTKIFASLKQQLRQSQIFCHLAPWISMIISQGSMISLNCSEYGFVFFSLKAKPQTQVPTGAKQVRKINDEGPGKKDGIKLTGTASPATPPCPKEAARNSIYQPSTTDNITPMLPDLSILQKSQKSQLLCEITWVLHSGKWPKL